MDGNSLYTNIHREEGADVCYKKLETRKNKTSIKHLEKLHSINSEM